MASIHTEDVALFSIPPYNYAEDDISWDLQGPSYIASAKESSIKFHIAGNSTQYVDLSRSELYVKLSVRKRDDKEFNETLEESGVPINTILHTMWQTCDIELNKIMVSTSGNNYMYKAFIETLLNYNYNAQKFQLQSLGFSHDSKNFDATSYNEIPVNNGFRERHNWFNTKVKNPKARPSEENPDPNWEEYIEKNFQACEFLGPFNADICNQGRIILNSVDIDITLKPTSDKFRLLTHPKGLSCFLEIEDIYLNVCKVDVADSVMIAHNSTLQSSNSKYPIQETDIRTYEITANSCKSVVENIYNGVIPARIIVAMVKSSAYCGEFHLNPLKFEAFDIQNATLFINGKQKPRRGFNFDIEENIFLEGMMSLYKSTGKSWENTDISIDRNSWPIGHALIAFDVDPTSSADFMYLGKPKFGHTRLELTFKRPIPENITLILYSLFPARVEIDQARNVSTIKQKDLLEEILNLKAPKVRSSPYIRPDVSKFAPAA